VQQQFVCAHHARFICAGKPLLFRARPRREKTVVIEQEQGRDGDRAVRSVPDPVRIFRRYDTQAAAEFDEPVVAPFAAQPRRIRSVGPQLMVTRRPNDSCKPFAQEAQRPFDIGEPFTNVAREKQPVRGGIRIQARAMASRFSGKATCRSLIAIILGIKPA
jgi:hypothetical protein